MQAEFDEIRISRDELYEQSRDIDKKLRTVEGDLRQAQEVS